MSLQKVLNMKINLVATIAISILASASTIVISQALDPLFVSSASETSQPLAVTTSNVTNCETGVYSPVQNTCVSKEVFDNEMQRLFAALGIDTSIYGLGKNNN